jgi:hypothetical protein
MSGRHARRLCCREASRAERLYCCCLALWRNSFLLLARVLRFTEFETSCAEKNKCGDALTRYSTVRAATSNITNQLISYCPRASLCSCCPPSAPHNSVDTHTVHARLSRPRRDERPHTTAPTHTRNSTQRKYTSTPHDPGAYKTPSSFPPCLRSLVFLVRARSCI